MSEDCPHCVYEKNEANCRGCFEESHYRPKPVTNADRFRTMSIEEIENWFWWMHKEMMRYTDSRVFVHDWLRQKAEECE